MNPYEYEWKNKKVLVTGASGFKGSWLCAVLERLGANVFGTTKSQVNPLSAYDILGLDHKINCACVDISDRQEVYDIINTVEPEIIFHLAAKALVPSGLRDPRRTFDVNVMGTLNVLEACRKLRVCRKLLICSTDHVFGNTSPEEIPPRGFEERDRVSYAGPYDTSKAAMELLIRCYHYTFWHELPAIGITRCANVFGYGDVNQRRVIPAFVRASLELKEIKVTHKKNGRQFLHITDAIEGYIRAATRLDEGGWEEKREKPRPEGRKQFTPTFHFALENYENTEEPFIRIEALADLIASIFGGRVEKGGAADYAPNENRVQALNCDETRNLLRWAPNTELRPAIGELGEWYNYKNDRLSMKHLLVKDLDKIMTRLKHD